MGGRDIYPVPKDSCFSANSPAFVPDGQFLEPQETVPWTLTLIEGVRFIIWDLRRPRSPTHFWSGRACLAHGLAIGPIDKRPCATFVCLVGRSSNIIPNYEVHSISFQIFLFKTFKIVVDSWKFRMLLLYIFWDHWPIFMISRSNEQLRHELEYTLLKLDCHSRWLSKMPSGREDTLEERYAIKLCFKLGKKATETYEMLQTAFQPSYMNRASVFEWHKRFKEGRESVTDDERCGRSNEIHIPELIGQRVRFRVTMLRFLGSSGRYFVGRGQHSSNRVFPPGQCTSPQLHPCLRLLDQDGHQDSFSSSL